MAEQALLALGHVVSGMTAQRSTAQRSRRSPDAEAVRSGLVDQTELLDPLKGIAQPPGLQAHASGQVVVVEDRRALRSDRGQLGPQHPGRWAQHRKPRGTRPPAIDRLRARRIRAGMRFEVELGDRGVMHSSGAFL